MHMKSIETEQNYRDALKRLELIFDAAENTVEGDEAEILGAQIDNYENIHFPIEPPDPMEVVKFRLEQMKVRST